MSDICTYELEDIVWHEFGQSGDHIVPYPSSGSAGEHQLPSDNCKKPRYVIGPKEQGFSALNNSRLTMLEEGSWSDTPSAFPTSHDNHIVNKVSNLSSSEHNRTSSHCFKSNNMDSIGSEFCTNDHILDDQNVGVDGNSYSYPLGQISQSENDLSFLDDNNEEKNSSDLLDYGWPEIGNFDDVDRMFRSCDSTFGLGTSNTDELGWFSSSDVIEGSEDASRSDFKFSCAAPNGLENILVSEDAAGLNEASGSINNSGMRSQSDDSYRGSLWDLEKDECATLNHLSFVDGSRSSDYKDGSMPERLTNTHKKQLKHKNRSEGKRKGIYLDNGASFPFNGNLPEDAKQSTGANSSQSTFTSMDIQQHNHCGSDSFAYLQSSFPYMHTEYNHPSDQSSVRATIPSVKSENNALKSLSPKGSYVPNQLPSIQSSLDISFQVGTTMPNEKKLEKQLPSGFKSENHSDMNGINMEAPMQLDSSILLESSSISSAMDEVSEEAVCFNQLQHVMEQLDVKTKLCIRDSLYRLARSAEHRHRNANFNGGTGDNRDASGALVAHGADRCSGYMDIETDTNPIDRSIAHLLFHQPSDSPVIQGSITSTPVIATEKVGHGDAAVEEDTKAGYE
nr:protein LNK1 isoform X1 [Ipomoea batatas]